MKIRLLVFVALAIDLTLPTFAQEKTEAKPKILAAIQANDKAYDDAFNKHDATAIAALFATNAVMVAPDGVFNGRDNIQHEYSTLFLGADYSDHMNTLDQIHTASPVYPWAVSNWVMTSHGVKSTGWRFLTYIPEGGAWLVKTEVLVY
jgi:ketosteroid isomerase-like protein